MTETALSRTLAPRSIAIVGASQDSAKRGNMAIRYLQQNGFAGAVYPIHPREREILGLACYPSIEALPEAPDLALVCTPAHTLPELMERCGRRGVAGAVVLASGFSESGEAGWALEQAMVAAARAQGVRIVGPNTSGIFNAHCGANLVGYRHLQAGDLGLLSQSGNMALSLVTEAQALPGLGFSTYIGVGNEADVQFHEYLDYFAADPHTRAVVGYVEGLKQGGEFLRSATRVSQQKPIVLYKSGRSAVGQQSARSHTGALAGSYALARGVMRQAGVVLVERADELLPLADTLARTSGQLPLSGRRVAILADGGGHATIAVDALDAMDIEIPLLSAETQSALRALLPASAAVANPVDVAGGTDSAPALFADCAAQMLSDPGVDLLLIVGLFGGYALRFSESLAENEQQGAEALARLPAQFAKPILLQSLYQPQQTAPLQTLRAAGIPVFASVDLAARALASVVQYSQAIRRLAVASTATAVSADSSVSRLIASVRDSGRNQSVRSRGV